MNFSPLNAAPDAAIKRQIDKDASTACSRATPTRRNKPGLTLCLGQPFLTENSSEHLKLIPGMEQTFRQWHKWTTNRINYLLTYIPHHRHSQFHSTSSWSAKPWCHFVWSWQPGGQGTSGRLSRTAHAKFCWSPAGPPATPPLLLSICINVQSMLVWKDIHKSTITADKLSFLTVSTGSSCLKMLGRKTGKLQQFPTPWSFTGDHRTELFSTAKRIFLVKKKMAEVLRNIKPATSSTTSREDLKLILHSQTNLKNVCLFFKHSPRNLNTERSIFSKLLKYFRYFQWAAKIFVTSEVNKIYFISYFCTL